MGQVAITMNGRTYRLACGEGEEERLREMADCVKQKLEGLVAEFGQVGESRLMVMAALMVADDLLEARAKSGRGQKNGRRTAGGGSEVGTQTDEEPDGEAA